MKLFAGKDLVYDGPVRTVSMERKLKYQLVTEHGMRSTYHAEADIEFSIYGDTEAIGKCYTEGSRLALDMTLEGKHFTGYAHVTQWTSGDDCHLVRIHGTIDDSESTFDETREIDGGIRSVKIR